MIPKMLFLLNKSYLNVYSSWKLKQIGIRISGHVPLAARKFLIDFSAAFRGNRLVFFDIGASIGVISDCVARLPNVAQIHSFEPLPEVYTQLRKQMRFFSKAHCHQVALGDSNGVASMHINKSSTSSSILPAGRLLQSEFPWTMEERKEEVAMARLDDFVRQFSLPGPDVIKVDVQGYELSVIKGGQDTISQAKYCILEMNFQRLNQGGAIFDDVYQAMRQLGFRLIGFGDAVRGVSHRQMFTDGLFAKDIAQDDKNA